MSSAVKTSLPTNFLQGKKNRNANGVLPSKGATVAAISKPASAKTVEKSPPAAADTTPQDQPKRDEVMSQPQSVSDSGLDSSAERNSTVIKQPCTARSS